MIVIISQLVGWLDKVQGVIGGNIQACARHSSKYPEWEIDKQSIHGIIHGFSSLIFVNGISPGATDT